MLTEKLRELRRKKHLTQNELSKILKVSNGAIAMWETGRREPDANTIKVIADYFNVSIDYLLGNEEPKTHSMVRIPVLGTIPAGIPLEAIEDILDYEDISPAMLTGGKQFFALRIQGRSMFPKYLEGDIVIFQKQDYCESGEDCAVYVNGYDATFKKIKLNENGITLQPINSDYEPMFYNNEEIENLPVRIIGKAVEIRRKP